MGNLSSPVSVVIPVYEDPDGLSQTLKSLESQTYTDYRVLVSVTPSTGETVDIAEKYTQKHPDLFQTVIDKGSCPASGRNAGIEHSEGEYVLFLDANMTVELDYIESIVSKFTTTDVQYLGCNVEIIIPDGKHSLVSKYNQVTGFPMEQYISEQNYAPTCALAVDSKLIEDVGMFDSDLNSAEDVEFGNRVSEAGYTLHYAPEITAFHPARTSMKELWDKNLRVGRGLCQLQKIYPARYGEPGIPPRPSGIKSPSTSLSKKERVVFGLISNTMTAVRGIGYYLEFFSKKSP